MNYRVEIGRKLNRPGNWVYIIIAETAADALAEAQQKFVEEHAVSVERSN
jgi:hypothetical protein